MEKIYDLCDKCKSKVKFEITKQDGILKQYLYKLGNFDFLFERNRPIGKYNFDGKKTNPNKPKPSNSYFTVLIYSMIFLLSSITLIFNDFDHLDQIDEKVLNISELDHVIESLNFKLKSSYLENIIKTIKDSFQASITLLVSKSNFTIQPNLFDYINLTIPFNLIMIYFLCCLFAIFSTKSSKKNLNHIGFIWALDLALILTNYKKYMKYFKYSETGFTYSFDHINLNFVLVLIPIMQIVILKQLTQLTTNRLFSAKKTKLKSSKTIQLDKKHINSESPFKNQVKLTNINLKNLATNSNVQFNYASISSQNSYSLVKYLQSNLQEGQSVFKSKTEVIKPARFRPTNISENQLNKFQHVPASVESSGNVYI